MVKETEPSIPEKAFILQALKEGYRLDCRNKTEFRNIEIKLGREFGHAEVQLGSTRLVWSIGCLENFMFANEFVRIFLYFQYTFA